MDRRLVAAALVIAALAPAGGTPASEGDDRALFAVLRRDGVVIPFAALARGRWSMPWPTVLRSRDLPPNLEAVPSRWWGGAPRVWRLFRPDGAHVRLELGTPRTVRVMCDERLGLTTDRRPGTLPESAEQPYPKEGLAIGGTADVRAIDHLPPGSARWVALQTVIQEAAHGAEEQALRAAAGVWRHPMLRSARAGVPLELEAAYVTPMADTGWTVAYVEAAKRYPARKEDEGCGPETFVRGWVQHDAERVAHIDLVATLTYCDRAAASYMLPLGWVPGGRRTFWLVQYSGWDHEWYSVARIERRRVHPELDYLAGRCPGTLNQPRGAAANPR